MKRRPSVLVIFLTVFIDLVGFGIIVPQLAIYGSHYGAGGWMLAFLFGGFSVMQFVLAPIWGRLSDRYGRRPILLISTGGAAVSYALFAMATWIPNHSVVLWTLLVSRAFAGGCGGNITVAQAYIADITPPQDRSRRMGLIGVAFGLGFILGPAIGGLSASAFGVAGPGWVASAICAGNFLLAWAVLAETRTPASEPARPRPHLEQWTHALTKPRVGLLIIVFFLATFVFSCFECTLALLISDNFQFDIKTDLTAASGTVASLFVFCATISVLVQGGAIGPLVKKFGEPRLIAISLFLTGISLALLPFIKGNSEISWAAVFTLNDWSWKFMLVALALLSVGSALTRPPLFGMLSNLTPAGEQGATIGVAQGASSLARVFGPLFALPLYMHVPSLPYVICGILSVAAGLFALQRLHRIPDAPGSDAPDAP